MRTRPNLRRSRCTSSALALATVLAVGATPAAAQSLQGTGSIVTNTGGAANISTGVNTTTVTLNPGQTVIDWTPFDNAVGNFGGIGFQYDGSTATFQSTGNFAVLNRINVADVTRVVSMDGDINGLVGGQTGGSIYFYSPSGFVLGSNATINVGSLVLSASPITVDGNGLFITGPNNTVTFGQAVNPSASITTGGAFGPAPGASVSASDYVAFVAPHVEHYGTINVAGQAALVAAEAATIDFTTDGLFNIQVTTGTTDGQGVVIGGDINGPASDGSTNHRVYAVAVPKNQLLTMTLTSGSTLGFDIAGAANVDGNTIVLSAGKDIVAGQIEATRSAGSGTGDAGIDMFGVTTTSALVSDATYNNIINAGVGTIMTGDVSIHSDRLARIYSATGTDITINGNVAVSGNRSFDPGTDGTAANAEIWGWGGDITINGDALVTADATGLASFIGDPGANVTGGPATIQAGLGGSVTVNGNADLSSNAYGGDSFGDLGIGGDAAGGSVYVGVYDANSQLTITGSLSATADAFGGTGGTEACTLCLGVGGDALGGFVTVVANDPGNLVSIGGSALLSADGSGGYGDAGGGSGRGRDVSVIYGAGSSLLFQSSLDASATGQGGSSGVGNGALGQGGRVNIGAAANATGGSITVEGDTSANVSGTGGDSYGGGTGGAGRGGTTDNGGSAGTLTFNGNFSAYSEGQGGYSSSGTGGYAEGGNVWLDAFGATISVGGDYFVSASAFGGSGMAGGNALGGNAYLPSSATYTVTGNATVLANGTGGTGFDGNGGNGTGGLANVRAIGVGHSLIVGGDVFAEATGNGGVGNQSGNGGNGQGGQTYVQAGDGGSINLGSLVARSNGWGGASFGLSTQGGTGTGGQAELQIYNGSTALIGGNARIAAFGSGNSSIDCTFCGGFGGDGFGGTAFLQTYGGGTNNVTIIGDVMVDARGTGASGFGGSSGSGTGGNATLQMLTAGTLSIGGNTTVTTTGVGGYHDQSGGVAGNGTGGNSVIRGNAGTITTNGSVEVLAEGYGGDANYFFGIGGDGTGGITARLVSNGGTVNVGGDARVSVSGFGGSGGTGGDGTATGDIITRTGGARIIATSGSVTINGNALADARGIGGNGGQLIDGTGGNGGDGKGGYATINANNSNIAPSTLTIVAGSNPDAGHALVDVSAIGGNGGSGGGGSNGNDGGNGGNATGGDGVILAAAGNGTTTIDFAAIDADATGGNGGAGSSGDGGFGGNGGNGGNAVGGTAQAGTESGAAEATASNLGSATFQTYYGSATATGGDGGAGGDGVPAGIGGNGGSAQDGAAILLVRGSLVTVGSVELYANAYGGDGGFGGYDYNVGFAASGIGGDAFVGGNGGLAVEVTDRFQIPAHRGTLDAGTIFGQAIATGGAGSVAGSGQTLGGSSVNFRNADATIDSLSFLVQAGSIGSGAINDVIAVTDGTVDVAGTFQFTTDSTLSLYASNGSLTAASIVLTAPDFVVDPNRAAPTIFGDYIADQFTITTGNNFIASANLISTNLLEIIAPGSITVNDIAGQDAVYLNAQSGSIAANDINADLEIRLTASTGITANDLTSGSYVYANTGGQLAVNDVSGASGIDLIGLGGVTFANLSSGTYANLFSNGAIIGGTITTGTSIYGESGGDMDLGVLDAGDWVELLAFGDMTVTSIVAGEYIDIATYLDGEGGIIVGGSIQTGDLTAGNSIDVHAGTSATLGNLSAGIVNPSTDPFAEYTIGVLANDFIVTGDIDTITHAGLASPGTITAGNVNVGGIFMVLGTGNISVGSIDAGTNVYMADFSMMALGGSLTEGFDPAPILASAPVATGGSITIGGPVTTGDFQALAGGTFDTGAITASGLLNIRSNGNLTTGNLDAGTQLIFGTNGNALAGSLTSGGTIDARSAGTGTYGDIAAADGLYVGANGALSFGDMIAGETARFGSDTSIVGGNVTAGNSVIGTSGGNVTLGNLSAGLVNTSAVPGALYEAVVFGIGDVSVGTIDALGEVQLAGVGSITAGDVTTQARMFAVSDGAINLGNLNVTGLVLIGGMDMFAFTGNLRTDFDASPTFDSAPAAAGGNFTAGNIVGGILRVTAGDIAVGDLLVDGAIDVQSGGNLTTGNVDSGSTIWLAADGSATTGSLNAPTSINMRVGGNILIGGAATTDGYIDIESFAGNISALDMTAGDSIELAADTGGVTADNLSAGLVNPAPAGEYHVAVWAGGGNILIGNAEAAGDILLAASGNLTTGDLSPGARLLALAGGNMQLGAINGGSGQILIGNYSMFALGGTPGDGYDVNLVFAAAPVRTTGSITLGNVSASSLSLAAGGNLTIGNVDAANDIVLDAGGNMVAGDIQSLFGDIDLTANGSITAGDLTAGAGILVDGGGAVSLGNVAAGVTPILFGFGTQDIGVGYPVEIFGASIATGNISTDGYVGLYTPGAVSTGSITAFHDIVALAGGNANFGAITTDESFLLAGYGNFASLLTPGGQFDPSLIFSLFDYSSTGGNAVYGGPVSASVIGSYAGGNTTVGAMTAGSYADIDTGGTLFLTGAITSPGFVGLTSSDIDIGANASVAAGSIGFLSISSVGTFIGDNTGGNGGYRLSQAEIGRTTAGAYEFEVQTDRGAAATMIVGDLTLDMTGSQYNDVAEFWIGNDQTEVPNGIIRVVGDTLFRVNIDQEVSFEAGTIEVDAATGSISLVDGQNNLSGYLGLYAPNIFVASADILAKLEVDPRYAGYVDELNAPAAVQRPNGVIRAASLEIDSFYAPLANILVQNTGTADVPAGFLITDADIGDGETTPEPGSINLVINGQIVTEGGTLTGIDVRDLLVDAFGTEAFVPESTINGCALAGDCRAPVEELPPAVVVTPPIIEILTGDPLGEPGFGNEPDIDDNVDGDGTEAGSPISAPQPLFDTRPLVDSSLIDDPISGAGNPSLYGSSDEDDDDDDEDDGKDKKDVRKGDGK